MRLSKEEWDKSYERHENFIFYPKEEAVKFLNRFVRKRIAVDKFIDIIDFSKKPIRGLDFGCGIGRLAILMKEWGIDAYGIDISPYALKTARELAAFLGFVDMRDKFILGNGTKLPFPKGYFDVVIAESVLDSMPISLARKLVTDIARVTKGVFFLSLISGDNSEHSREFAGEEKNKTSHEKGTIQSYYNWGKIHNLIAGTRFKIIWAQLITSESLTSPYKYSRYYLVLKTRAA